LFEGAQENTSKSEIVLDMSDLFEVAYSGKAYFIVRVSPGSGVEI
jgi:hypothetical protein